MSPATRRLGHSDLHVSVIGLGGNNFGRTGSATEGQDGTDAVLGSAIDAGITLLDTAALYGEPESLSETMIGRSLGNRRDAVVIATKWGHTRGPEPADWGARGSRGFIRRAIDASLTRLRTDHVDLYQLHEPDPTTPIEETISALEELVAAGKIRFYGHSNFTAEQIADAATSARAMGVTGFVSGQNEYSPLRRDIEDAVLPALREARLGLLPFYPLASGLLTGKYTRSVVPDGSRLALRPERHSGVSAEDWDRIAAYRTVCDEAGVSMLEATFAWLLAQDPVTSVIAGATTPEQVNQNAKAGSVELPAELVPRISDIFSR